MSENKSLEHWDTILSFSHEAWEKSTMYGCHRLQNLRTQRWIWSSHFLFGAKSNDPLLPDYIPSLFSRTNSVVTRKLVRTCRGMNKMHTPKDESAEVQTFGTICHCCENKNNIHCRILVSLSGVASSPAHSQLFNVNAEKRRIPGPPDFQHLKSWEWVWGWGYVWRVNEDANLLQLAMVNECHQEWIGKSG